MIWREAIWIVYPIYRQAYPLLLIDIAAKIHVYNDILTQGIFNKNNANIPNAATILFWMPLERLYIQALQFIPVNRIKNLHNTTFLLAIYLPKKFLQPIHY